jgi:hypothetical protein
LAVELAMNARQTGGEEAAIPYLAAQVRKLSTVRHPGESLSQGMVTLEANLARARAVDADTHAHDRHAERLEVEQALIVTLKWSGIVLPFAAVLHPGLWLLVVTVVLARRRAGKYACTRCRSQYR